MFALGVGDARAWLQRQLAWTQVNLINVQIPKGKPKLRIESLLPAKPTGAIEDVFPDAGDMPGATPAEKLKAAKNRVRGKLARRDADEFWRSAEGRRIVKLLGEE